MVTFCSSTQQHTRQFVIMEAREMQFTPVRKINAYEAIVDQVEEALRTGALKAGDRLPSERQMMEDFSVSRTTVREALKVLQATGAVSSRPGDPRGPIVTTYSPELLEKSLVRMASLTTVSRVELLQFRLILEGNACLLAAEFHSDEEMRAIEEAAAELARIATDPQGAFGAGVNAFHASIRRASHNVLIEACGNAVGGLMGEMIDSRLINDADRELRLRHSAEAAGNLVNAIRERRAYDAATIVKRNIFNYYAGDLSPSETAHIEPIAAYHDVEAR